MSHETALCTREGGPQQSTPMQSAHRESGAEQCPRAFEHNAGGGTAEGTPRQDALIEQFEVLPPDQRRGSPSLRGPDAEVIDYNMAATPPDNRRSTMHPTSSDEKKPSSRSPLPALERATGAAVDPVGGHGAAQPPRPAGPAAGRAERQRYRHVRYGDLLAAVRPKQRAVSYNAVAAHQRAHPQRAPLRLKDVHRLVTPYASIRFLEQLRVVLPLALFLALFQIAALRTGIEQSASVTLGILAVMLGLMFFMEGIKHGLMPFSEAIGYALPNRLTRGAVLAVAVALGMAATFAEPAIGALRAAGSGVQRTSAPYLYLFLNRYSAWLVLSVAVGVGLAVAVGMLRFYHGWTLKNTVIATMLPCLALTVYAGLDPGLEPLLGLAWDCGAITTGPVTVPLVLAVGIGVSAAAGRADNPLSGFGLVTLASLFPVIFVTLVGIMLSWQVPAAEAATAPVAAMATLQWHEQSPIAEIKASARAIVPLVLFLLLIQLGLLRQRAKKPGLILYGIALALIGMTFFNLGLSFGLIPLGDQTGSAVPSAFMPLPDTSAAALYPYWTGIVLSLTFAAAVGYGATIAEPALSAMGLTVESLTDGALPRTLLVRAVALGVAVGTAVGVAKLLFHLPMLYLLLGAYGVALALTVLSSEQYVNLAWDSAGVTTGPVTVPLILSLGLGLGEAVGAREGFGILAMASVGPILSVLTVGLWIQGRGAMSARRGEHV